MTGVAASRVSPFGHPGLIGCVPLPLAYRSLPRPSSPPCAQASPTGLLSLDHKCRQAQHAQKSPHGDFTHVRSSVQSPSLVRRRRRLASWPHRPMRIRFPRGLPHHCDRPLLDPSLVNQRRFVVSSGDPGDSRRAFKRTRFDRLSQPGSRRSSLRPASCRVARRVRIVRV